MKTTAIIFTTAIVCVVLLFWSTRSQMMNLELVLMDDVTDTLVLKPEISAVQSFLELDKDMWKGVNFKYIHLNDLGLNPSRKITLKPERWWLGNELERLKKVKTFESDLRDLEKATDTRPKGKKQSSLFIPIVKELNRLATSNEEKRSLIVYSDLMENTQAVSFYDTATFSLMQKNPQLLREVLSQGERLTDLSGIKVYLVYQPTTALQDERFSAMSSFYRNWFEDLGGTVFVQARLDLTP